VAHELACAIDVFSLKNGRLSLLQTLPALQTGKTTDTTAATLKLGADARFLYVSTRGRDRIAIFRVREEGRLEPVADIPSGGSMPRDFAIDPTGAFLLVCHQESDNLVIFRVNGRTGLLEKVREYGVPSGVCVITR
jgi:6-phosphogluconolactonase